ncbi:MAG: GNAT family N-acetyltransferase [Frankiales bacterium]|nr:GNAT family N-acetyltransferase [Frankiales bacterium]
MRVEVAGPGDWAQWRDLRLQALRDTPLGFVETAETALAKDEAAWRRRMTEVPLSLLARSEGRPVAMVSGFLIADRPYLGAVFIAPAARGRGLLARLVEPVAVWAWAFAPVLLLEVHEANPRAITAYARLGFVDTGERRDYPLEPGGREIVMALRPAAS